MKAFATIQEMTRESDIIFVKCDDGKKYWHTKEDYLADITVGEWIYPKDWNLVEE